ncbi:MULTISPECIES: 23S rRNA (adenine(2503)-C(2))-methyltransferase RlmN [Pontibacter]|uniref:Probable dual-specificity RNA methyltransferase RlmN n=2 Tax=Pontibacter TaxID=323449 RepID=A0A2N3UC72_9BACT|nr:MULTISPECIES: 23S rRNA (adenine(2503)-C(2))-methyltransferase RlmN [Pontibacter]PKV66990.1 23S rRNA m(2)A-2503 methyltransferase [Pontibacter ramchanderi]SIT90176.1 23S rRNA m(2)A-2503 methyltransferase [Pontibacter indicus]
MNLIADIPVLTKKDIRKLSLDDLKAWLVEQGEKAFRAKQVYEWIWKHSAQSFEEMNNVSLALREKLDQHFAINAVQVATKQISNDGTIKSAFKLYDNNIVEGVLIPHEERKTACVSSQVGCSLTCKFCATGYMDRVRNLDAAEIYDQVVRINQQSLEQYGQPLSNIVYMGMGEPMLNYANVMKSIERITAHDGLGMAARRITVSTAGIAKMIKKMADDGVKANLALSLHAANDEKRNQIMPINETNSLEALTDALKHFHQVTGRKVTYEYIVFQNFNDTLEDAEELYRFSKVIPCKINLIEYNPIENADYKNTDEERWQNFIYYLADRGVQVNVRRSRGKDIDAACGQLAVKEKQPA